VGQTDDERPTDAHAVVEASDGLGVEDNLAPGTDVGGYIVDGELGSGGMGVVYSATHPVIGKRAAIKVLKPELSGNPAAVERFIMEARAVNQIGHPNIVDIFAFGTLPDGRSYYVMDMLAGESLRRRLKRAGPLHISEAASVIDEVASALIAAHDKGIIHRDLKPDNVFMVSVSGRWPEVRLLDWGLLKLSSTQSAVGGSKYKTLAGSVMGTPVYMSPEQGRASDAVDFRTDIYSLGVMAYEILSGTVPFKKGSSVDTLIAHQDEPVPPLAHKCPALPEELVQLIEAMLCKDRDGRPTLAAIRAVLKRLKGTKIPTMTAAGLQMPSGPGSPFVEPPAIDQNRTLVEQPSMQLTAPRQSTLDPGSLSMSEISRLPAPPQPPEHPSMPSMPYQSMSVSTPGATLAGHSMPMASQRQPMFTTPVPGSPLPQHARAPSHPGVPQHSPIIATTRGPVTSTRRIVVILAAAAVVSTIGIILLLSQ
jgi:serine/threonine protein kinase